MTPSARSKRWLEEHGYKSWTVECYIHQVRRRIDCFNFFDIIAMPAKPLNGPGSCPLLAVQATSLTNVSHRMAKLAAEPNLALWLQHGHLCVIHGWGLGGKRGKRKTYRLRQVQAKGFRDGDNIVIKWIEVEEP